MVQDSLFFCIKGENSDGNVFANEALEKGAKYVITDNKQMLGTHRAAIVVDDVLKTLQQLACYHRQQLTIPIIGITGTNGKTTTKELVARVLAKKYNTASTSENFNNHIGVPLTLLSIKKEDEVAVVEMGANHRGEIAELCRIAQPQYGLITNIGKAHLEGFGTMESIVETKTALYTTAKVLFVNIEDGLLRQQAEEKVNQTEKKELYFYGKNSDTTGTILQMNPYLVLNLFGNKIQTQFTGNYNLPNILAAAAIGCYFGVPKQDICNAISEYTPQNKRSQIINTKYNTIIADYYNANPSSMKAALLNFLEIDAPNKLAILGDMMELGENSIQEHKTIIDFCEQHLLKTFFIGAEFYKNKNNRSHFFINVDDCNDNLKKIQTKNRFILIKGSRGIHLENIAL